VGIRFELPWLLLLLVPLPVYGYWLVQERSRLFGMRKAAALSLRLIIFVLLIMALAGAQWFENIDKRTVVFVADRSDSMQEHKTIQDWIRQASAVKSGSDAAGVISAGAEPVTERYTSEHSLEDLVLDGVVHPEWTDLGSALRLGSGLLSTQEGGRLVLVSDGLENTGDVLKEGRLLRNRNIPVDVLHLPGKQTADAAVDSLKVPQMLYQGEAYDVETTVISTQQSDAVLRLYADERELAAMEVRLEKGENRFAFPALARDPGLHRYRAEIYMPSDGQSANNAGYAYGRVAGRSKVLIVEGEPGASRNIESALSAAFIAYTTVPPEMLPQELSDYTAYESVLLNNVPATRISLGQMDRLEQAVRDYGTGLMMLGGDQSFGLGGYFQTPIEKALPVYMELKGKREIPSLALVLVIDKSGSMQGENIRLAQEAAVRSVELLRPKDTLGVLAFDDAPWWVVKPGKLEDKEKVKKDILSIPADGGTSIYPAVKEAFDKLAETDAQRKHIILLTDGQSATQESYEALAARMGEANVTVSTVAIGDGADTQLLERIARLAKGRYYLAADISTVPAIFSREAVLMSRTYVVENPFTPVFGQGADWYRLFSGGIPRIHGYIAATPKETAEVSLLSPEPDPLLARWRYGAGKSVAWTSDAAGKWSKEWTAWSGYPAFLAETVKWTFPEFQHSPYELSVRTDGGETRISVKTGHPASEKLLTLEVTDELLHKHEAELTPVMPGEYTARFPNAEAGVYMARLKMAAGQSEADQTAGAVTGFVIPYSPEYRLHTHPDGEEKLKQLAALTGGRVLELGEPEKVFQVKPPRHRTLHDLVKPLVTAALLLLLADIAVRRLTLPWHRLAAAGYGGLWRRKQLLPPEASPSTGMVERLERRKEKLSPLFQPSSAKERSSKPSGDREPDKQQGIGEQRAQLANRDTIAGAKPDSGSVLGHDNVPASSEDRLSRLMAAKQRKNTR
jgi:Ca-activated chloride channel homolog